MEELQLLDDTEGAQYLCDDCGDEIPENDVCRLSAGYILCLRCFKDFNSWFIDDEEVMI